MYFTRRLPVVQNLDFCLIGRKTNDPSPEALHPIGQAAYLTSGAIRWVLLTYGHLTSLHDRNHEMTLKRKLLTAEIRTSCYLLPLVRISAISSSMLSCSYWAELLSLISDEFNVAKVCKKLLFDNFKPVLLPTDETDHERLLPQNQFLYFDHFH